MIKAIFGITQEPFQRQNLTLLPQQSTILDMIKIHAQQGGFSVITGNPGVGKSILREHIEALGTARDTTVASCSRTMHTYLNVLKQLAESFRIDVPAKDMEKALIAQAYDQVRDRKTLYSVIDEAHLLDRVVLRKLRLLFEQFPKNHNLVLLGQRDLLHYLSLTINQDIKSRITYSQHLLPLNDDAMAQYIDNELETVGLGINTYDSSASKLIIRSARGNLRLCRNLCYGSLLEACRETQKIVTLRHVNEVLVQPHWRSQEELIKQQAK